MKYTETTQTFGAHERTVEFENLGGSFYITIRDHEPYGEELGATVESKEIIRMAHWLIKEFG